MTMELRQLAKTSEEISELGNGLKKVIKFVEHGL